MRAAVSSQEILGTIACARLIVTHAERIGIGHGPSILPGPVNHLGAVLADSVLQAGLNYRTIVKVRVDRIQHLFPEAATLSGLFASIQRKGVSDFLLWYHPTKLDRFISLAELLRTHDIEDVSRLRTWLMSREARNWLLATKGIGPKTVDYLCNLVGIDCVAVDRHLRRFAKDAGVVVTDYESLRTILSCAADLLGIARRDFDFSVWRYVSERRTGLQQRELF
jgi:hypothetical protein